MWAVSARYGAMPAGNFAISYSNSFGRVEFRKGHSGCCLTGREVLHMKTNYISKRIFGALFALLLVVGVATVGSSNTQAQWRRDDRRRDRTYDPYRRDRGYYNTFEIARQQGYSYGMNVGAMDAQRGQSYQPQRSRYFKNADQGYRSEFGNKGQYKQVFRDAFVQGYREGFQRYAYNRRSNNGRWWPN